MSLDQNIAAGYPRGFNTFLNPPIAKEVIASTGFNPYVEGEYVPRRWPGEPTIWHVPGRGWL